MLLKVRRWGPVDADCVVCVHGLTQHGGVFDALARRLVASGRSVVAVDLRGHGGSGFEPPWSEATHVDDLLETLDGIGVRRVAWVGHSFGGRLAAAAAARREDPSEPLALLEPGLAVSPQRALRSAETERLDWSFATIEGAIQAILSSPTTLAAPRDVVAAYVEGDVRKGPDGRYRFGFSPAAAVVAWSEMTLPPPPVAACPTLVVRAASSYVEESLRVRYEEALGDLLTVVEVPNGHNVLWESPQQTFAAIERFLGGCDRQPAEASRA
jgi:pimeloyl-ACP methyl ester carboxylesterase